MAEKEVRKTTTKRAVRRVATKTVPARTTARKTASTSVRKAPSRVATPAQTRKSPKVFFVGFALFLVLLGVSAAIGFTDKGQLDVEASISLRKQNASPEEQQALNAVPVQQSQAVPNGGLVGEGPADVVPVLVPENTGSTTASTTDTTASSTEEVQAEAPVEEVTEVPPQEEPATPPAEETPAEQTL